MVHKMKESKKTNKKQFNPVDYKGYIAVLIGLLIILFVLIGIAIGMVKDEYFSNTVHQSETEIIEDKQTESQIETETVTASLKVDKEDPLLILINRDHPVPDDLEYTLIELPDDHFIDERAYDDLQAMLDAAKKEGHELVICSSWRSRSTQENLYSNKIEEYLSYGYSQEESEELAAFWVAMPGTSEHEIGLALDIVSEGNQRLDHSQEDTPEQQWLMEHCYEYGFILRYPEDKQEITQIGYEPWHYRYVGRENAREITAQGLCLEEYLMK